MEESFEELEESLINIIHDDLEIVEDSFQEESYEQLVNDVWKLCSSDSVSFSSNNTEQKTAEPDKFEFQHIQTVTESKLPKETYSFLTGFNFPRDCNGEISFQYFSSWLLDNYPVLGDEKNCCKEIDQHLVQNFLNHIQSCDNCKERNLLDINGLKKLCNGMKDSFDSTCSSLNTINNKVLLNEQNITDDHKEKALNAAMSWKKLDECNEKLSKKNCINDSSIHDDNSIRKLDTFQKFDILNNGKQLETLNTSRNAKEIFDMFKNANLDKPEKCSRLDINSPNIKKDKQDLLPGILCKDQSYLESLNKFENKSCSRFETHNICSVEAVKEKISELTNNVLESNDGEFKIALLPDTALSRKTKLNKEALTPLIEYQSSQDTEKLELKWEKINEMDQQLKIINHCLENITETEIYLDQDFKTNTSFKYFEISDKTSVLKPHLDLENSNINNLTNEENHLKDQTLSENHDKKLNVLKSKVNSLSPDNNIINELVHESMISETSSNLESNLSRDRLELKNPTSQDIGFNDSINDDSKKKTMEVPGSLHDNKLIKKISKTQRINETRDNDQSVVKSQYNIPFESRNRDIDELNNKNVLEVFKFTENTNHEDLLNEKSEMLVASKTLETYKDLFENYELETRIPENANKTDRDDVIKSSNESHEVKDSDSFILELFVDELLDKSTDTSVQRTDEINFRTTENKFSSCDQKKIENSNFSSNQTENNQPDKKHVDSFDNLVFKNVSDHLNSLLDNVALNDVNANIRSAANKDTASDISEKVVFDKTSPVLNTADYQIYPGTSDDQIFPEECENATSKTNIICDLKDGLCSNSISVDTVLAKEISQIPVNSNIPNNSSALKTSNSSQQKKNTPLTDQITLQASPIETLLTCSRENETPIGSHINENLESIDSIFEGGLEKFYVNKKLRLSSDNSSVKTQSVILTQIDDKPNQLSEVNNENQEAFVSDNPEENKDNNDPEWLFLKKLQTDDERYKAVRQQWKNLVISDPQCNLTIQNWRKSKEERLPIPNRCSRHKRLATSEPEGQKDLKRQKKSSCTINLDEKIHKLEQVISEQKYLLTKEHEQHTKQLSKKHINESWQLENDFSNCFNNCQNMYEWLSVKANFDRLNSSMMATHRQEFVLFQQLYMKRTNDIIGKFEEDLRKLRETREEVLAFYKFYSCLKNSSSENEDTTVLSRLQLQQLSETEEMYNLYDKYYR